MAVYVCEHCKALEPRDETHNNEHYLTFTDGEFAATGVSCVHCGRTGLKCAHPSSQFDKAQQAFVCSWCGEVDHSSESFMRLRAFAKQGTAPELQRIIDCTDH